MLFPRADLEGIAAGEITLAFRRWRRPLARAGSTQVTAIGVLRIESVETVDPDAVSDEDLRRAGRPDRASLVAEGPHDGALYRIALRLEGPDPRIALREDTALGDADRAALGLTESLETGYRLSPRGRAYLDGR